MNNVHRETFTIRSYEIDQHGYASIQTIGEYLQECAENHAQKLGVSVHSLFKKNLTWLLSRLHIKMSRYPRWSEAITVETWPSDAAGKFALRDFLILNNKQDVIGRATKSYVLFDLYAKKPISLPDFIHDIQIPNRDRALASDFPRLPEIERSDLTKTFNVRYSDLDINQHVNNVRYIEWAAETIPLEIWHSYLITDLEIAFRAETKYGDLVCIRAQIDGTRILHDMRTEKNNRNVARMRSTWSQR